MSASIEELERQLEQARNEQVDAALWAAIDSSLRAAYRAIDQRERTPELSQHVVQSLTLTAALVGVDGDDQLERKPAAFRLSPLDRARLRLVADYFDQRDESSGLRELLHVMGDALTAAYPGNSHAQRVRALEKENQR